MTLSDPAAGGSILEGITVVELCRHIAGPMCGQLLGDMGADVIKVESPRGDDTRGEEPVAAGISLVYMNYNRNKRSIVLDLRTEAGTEVLTNLVERADVLLQNFRPGVMEAMGLPYSRLQVINPRLVYLAISGFGRTGPYAQNTAFDEVIQAMSGLMSLTGAADGPPTLVGQPITDVITGVFSATAVLGALYRREATGLGDEVNVDLYGCALQAMNPGLSLFMATGEEESRAGNRNRYEAGINTYATRDGYVHLVAFSDAQWSHLAARFGGDEVAGDPRYATIAGRAQHIDTLDALIGGWLGALTTAEVLEATAAIKVPCGPVRTMGEVASDPELEAAGRLVPLGSPGGESVPFLRTPIHLERAPLTVRRDPPQLGQHTVEIARDVLGMSDDSIEQLHSAGNTGRGR